MLVNLYFQDFIHKINWKTIMISIRRPLIVSPSHSSHQSLNYYRSYILDFWENINSFIANTEFVMLAKWIWKYNNLQQTTNRFSSLFSFFAPKLFPSSVTTLSLLTTLLQLSKSFSGILGCPFFHPLTPQAAAKHSSKVQGTGLAVHFGVFCKQLVAKSYTSHRNFETSQLLFHTC